VAAAGILALVAAGVWGMVPAGPSADWGQLLGPPRRLAAAATGCMACHVNALDQRFSREAIDAVNLARRQRGEREIELPAVLLAHSRLDRLAGAGSPHAAVSCVSCHEGSDETAVHGRPHPAMRAIAYVQSNCVLCHRNGYDISDEAPKMCQGRQMFTSLGCVDCHGSEVVRDYEKRKVGPDLRHVDAKLSKAFVADWLMDPSKFRPSTAMPRVIRAGDPNARVEAEAITEYLFAHASRGEPRGGDPSALAVGDYQRGRMLFLGHGLENGVPAGLKAGVGCLACHSNLNERNGFEPQAPLIHFGPELSRIGEQLTKGRDLESARRWLFAWLKDPRQYHPETLMPNLRLSDQEASDLTAYLLGQRGGKTDEAVYPRSEATKDQLALGARLISHYGCMNCHEIGGPPLAQASLDLSDWGNKPLARLDMSRLDAAHQTRQDWLNQHLTDPAAVSPADAYDQPRMPFFHLTQEQAEEITTFVLGNRGNVQAPVAAAEGEEAEEALARGRAMTVLHNCVGCHQTEWNTPAIQRYFAPGWLSTFAPPPLRGEGNRVQYDWLRGFLKKVTPLRPLLSVRMPSFSFKEGEPEALVEYFHAASEKESGDLRRWMARGQTDRLDEWALKFGQAAAIDLNPAYSTPAQIAGTQSDILFKAEFTAELYDGPRRDREGAVPISAERFALGERFMQTMQCLDCHLMSADGSGDLSKAKAPNLDLVEGRLQRGWVRAWIQEPDVVRHGTNMPAYFSGLRAGDLNGRPLAEAERLTPAQAEAVEQFGKTVGEQTDLLDDFLFAAGARHYTTSSDARLNALRGRAGR
jgi:cbb3-type cytochrome oxidase cytochrome c subunit